MVSGGGASQAGANLKHTLLNGYYIFNHRKFSIRAVTNQNERQIRSAGSVVLQSVVSHLVVSDELNMIKENNSSYPVYNDLRSYEHWMFALLPGYTYSFVKNDVVLNATGSYGIAHYWETYSETASSDRDLNLNGIFHVNSYLGIDKKEWFSGILMEYRRFRSGSAQISNRLSYYSIRLAFGIRILEKGVLTRGISDFVSRNRQ